MYTEVTQETLDLFNQIITSNPVIPGFLNYTILNTTKSKTEIVSIKKSDDLQKHLSSYDFVILLNEDLFIKLNPLQQEILAVEITSQIHYDYQKGVLKLQSGDVDTFKSVLNKYGNKDYFETKELVELLFQQLKDKQTPAGVTAIV